MQTHPNIKTFKTQHTLGAKGYELTNHLGNVQVVVTDKKFEQDLDDDDTIDVYAPSLTAAYDYYPFGMLMPGRYTSDTAQHCTWVTQTKLIQTEQVFEPWPGWNCFPCNFKMLGGNTSFNVENQGGSDALMIIATNDTAAYLGGAEVDLDVTPNVASELRIPVGDITAGSFIAVVSEMVNGEPVELASDELVSGTLKKLSFTPTQSEVQLKLVNTSSGSGGLSLFAVDFSVLMPTAVNVLVRDCDESEDWRFGHHGAHKVNEWAGIGNHYTTLFREYDPRIGRWLSPDPAMAKYPGWSPYVFAFNNPILINDPLGDDPPSIKATLIYGQKNSRTFSSLMRTNSITPDNHGSFISFGHSTQTYNETGRITLAKSEDIKWQTVQLTHELTNRANIGKAQTLDKKVSEGKITPKQYAKQLAQFEVAGQINQVKVAAEIGYRYQGKEYNALNNVINKYAKGELTDKDLQKMVGANDEHLGTYERQGTGLRKQYMEKEAKAKQMESNINQNMDKLKSGSPPPVDNSLEGNTR